MVNFSLVCGFISSLERKFSKIDAKEEQWGNTNLRWLAFSASQTKHAIGTRLVPHLCQESGFHVINQPSKKGSDTNFKADDYPVCVKFSMLDESGQYIFEQIRNRDYQIIILLGVSPFSADIWAFRKEECFRCMRPHHNEEQRWAHVKPGNPPEWVDLKKKDACITGQSGKLEDFHDVLHQKIEECRHNESEK